MAITVNNTIDQYSPVYNPIGFSVTSTNYAQQNFNFIADVYINSSTTLTARLKFPVYPSSDDGYIDISGVLKNYLTSNLFTSLDTGFAKCGNSILRYDVYFGEQYGPSSGVTTNVNLTSQSGYAFNGSLEHVNIGNSGSITDWTRWNSSTYTYLNTITFLTNSPRTIDVDINGEDYFLYFLNTGSNKAYDCVVIARDSSNSIISTSTFTNSYATVGLYDTRLLRVGVGINNLSSPVPANTSWYTIQLRDNTTAATSELFRINLIDKCYNAYTTYRFIFKNKYGAFDAFTFYGQNQRNQEINRDFFKTQGATWASNIYSYSHTYRGDKQYNTVVKDTFKAQSDWITQAESDWLSELISSPEVYVVNKRTSGTTMIPVNIVNSTYDYKTTSRDQLFNLEIEFKPTYNSVRQQY